MFFRTKQSLSKALSRDQFYSSFFASQSAFFSTKAGLTTLELPVLKKLTDKALEINRIPPLRNTAIICVTHAFPTVIPLLHSFVRLGTEPKKIFVIGKLYSECETVVQKIIHDGFYYQTSSRPAMLGGFHRSFMRDINNLILKCIADIAPTDNLLILDHGGHALAFMPPELLEGRKVVGIEKTTAGLLQPETAGMPFPIIRMADCAAKKILESPIIAEEITEKLAAFVPIQQRQLICGVVGYGAVGKAIVDKLVSMGHKVMVYDCNKAKMQHLKCAVQVSELAVLVANCEYILDCTGDDISVTTEILNVTNNPKTLISCSSEDKAFRSLLQLVQSKYNGKLPINALSEITYQNEMGFSIRILRGGFPINFDNLSEASSPEDIQLTRALVLAGVIQSIEFFNHPTLLHTAGSYMLDPALQKFVVQEWFQSHPPATNRYLKNVIEGFNNEEWIANNSGGQYEEFDSLRVYANKVDGEIYNPFP